MGHICKYKQLFWTVRNSFYLQTLEQGKEASEESSEEEEEEVQCVDLEPVANIDELFDDFRGHLFLMLVFFVGI